MDLTTSIVLPSQCEKPSVELTDVDTAIADVTQMVNGELIPELEETCLRQRKLEKSLDTLTNETGVMGIY